MFCRFEDIGWLSRLRKTLPSTLFGDWSSFDLNNSHVNETREHLDSCREFLPYTGITYDLIHALNKFHEHWMSSFHKIANFLSKCCRNFQKLWHFLVQPCKLVNKHTNIIVSSIRIHLHPQKHKNSKKLLQITQICKKHYFEVRLVLCTYNQAID